MEETGASSDRELMTRFRGGDRAAFLEIYRAHSPAVFRFAFHMTGDRNRADEITQDVFVWLIHHPGAWDAGRGAIGPFLGGVARKMVHQQRRSERRWLPLSPSTADAAVFDAAFDRDQQASSLRRAIALLPERYREVVVLCDLEGKSYEEAAAIQGCAVGTVRSRLHRARGLLARKFQNQREDLKCL
jgi:RNA polymerase sigma-70 factor (ECF subfamily)